MEYKVTKINLSSDKAQYKIKNWCAYQERSQHETRQKLFEYGLFSEDVENIISKLIEENFLNEQRFSLALASGKFNIKHWGRNKIKNELKKHRITDYCITQALNSLDKNEYELIINKVIEKKFKLLKTNNSQKNKYIVLQYLISKGFESDIVLEILNKHLEKIK